MFTTSVAPQQKPSVTYLTSGEAAELCRMSVRAIHGHTAAKTIPHRRLPGTRRCLFLEDELRRWLDGAPLEVVELDGGGRVVRPVTS